MAKHSRQLLLSHDGNHQFDQLQTISSVQKSEHQNDLFNDLDFRFPSLDNNSLSNSLEQQVIKFMHIISFLMYTAKKN